MYMKINEFVSNPWSKTEVEVGTQQRSGFSTTAASIIRRRARRSQLIHASRQRTKSHAGGATTLKDVKNEGRSGNVYENKGSDDQLSESISGICAWLKVILQRISVFDGEISPICGYRMCFWRNFISLTYTCSRLRRVLLCPGGDFC
jgi:hypothetical protein